MTTELMTAPWSSRVLTTAPPGDPAWHAAHKGKLGGHDVASLLGYGRETPLQLWCRFTEKVEDEDKSDLPWLEDGSDFEPIVKRRYERATGNRLLPSPGLVQHATVPYLAGTPDGLVEEGVKPLGLFEAKTYAMWSRDQWEAGVPDGYNVQATLYLMVLGLDWADIAAMQQGGRKKGDPAVLTFTIVLDPNLAQWILDKAGEFMERYVETDIPPPALAEDTGVLRQMLGKPVTGKVIPLTQADQDLVDEKESIQADLRRGEKLVEGIKATLMQRMDTAQYGTLPDGRFLRFQMKRYGAREAGESRVLDVVKRLS